MSLISLGKKENVRTLLSIINAKLIELGYTIKKVLILKWILVIFLLSVQCWASEIVIIDADTIELDGLKIRLSGIDAPEMEQSCEDINFESYSCGVSSREALQTLIKGMPKQIVQCVYFGKDMYNRSIGECSIGKININMWLVENGWALAYRKYSGKYVKNENIAKINRAGIWIGKFTEPWNWRRGKQLHTNSEKSNDECLIKGNISSDGERIYHLPNGDGYDRTKISVEKGERWFCSREEAEENGWRRSKR